MICTEATPTLVFVKASVFSLLIFTGEVFMRIKHVLASPGYEGVIGTIVRSPDVEGDILGEGGSGLTEGLGVA